MFSRTVFFVHTLTGKVTGFNCQELLFESDAVSLETPAGHIMVDMTGHDFQGVDLSEFVLTKQAVIANGKVAAWEDCHSGLAVSVSETPKVDGSNTPTVMLEDGLPGADYVVTSTAGVMLNSGRTGTLDSNGEGSLRLKITNHEVAELTIVVSPGDTSLFKPVQLKVVTDYSPQDF